MDADRVLVVMDAKSFTEVLNKFLKEYFEVKLTPDFENDRLSKIQAAKLAGITIPTLDKLIKIGKFKQYNLGKRKYLLRSEMHVALRTIG